MTFYDVFYGPLSGFSGPKMSAASNLPLVRAIWTGQEHDIMLQLHERYGPIVRIGPKYLSYNTSQAWQDNYSLAKKGKRLLLKGPGFYPVAANGVRDVFSAT